MNVENRDELLVVAGAILFSFLSPESDKDGNRLDFCSITACPLIFGTTLTMPFSFSRFGVLSIGNDLPKFNGVTLFAVFNENPDITSDFVESTVTAAGLPNVNVLDGVPNETPLDKSLLI